MSIILASMSQHRARRTSFKKYTCLEGVSTPAEGRVHVIRRYSARHPERSEGSPTLAQRRVRRCLSPRHDGFLLKFKNNSHCNLDLILFMSYKI